MSAQEILTKKQVLLSRLSLGVAIILLSVFLILCGSDAINLPLKSAAAPAVLAAAGLVCLFWAVVQDNTLLLWFFPIFILCALVSVLSLCTAHGYGTFYPIYIAAPAISSIVTAAVKGKWHYHLKIIAVFLLSASIFLMHSVFSLSIAITIPLFLLFAGGLITVYAITKKEE